VRDLVQIQFVRHALSIANVEKILQGQLDTPLSDEGKSQAASLRNRLNLSYDRVYSSSLKRAEETAEIALQAQVQNGLNIIYRDDLREIGLGILEGKNFSEIELKYQDMWSKINTDPDYFEHQGETGHEFYNRTVKAFSEIVDDAKYNNIQSILIFTHGGVMKVILDIYLKLANSPFENTESVIITLKNGKWKLIERSFSI
jgi:probable phosphoglycerate mutase